MEVPMTSAHGTADAESLGVEPLLVARGAGSCLVVSLLVDGLDQERAGARAVRLPQWIADDKRRLEQEVADAA